jgi:hypothetical protein
MENPLNAFEDLRCFTTITVQNAENIVAIHKVLTHIPVNRKIKFLKCFFSFFKNIVKCNLSSEPGHPKPSIRTNTDTTGYETVPVTERIFLPEMRKCARMLKQKRFAAHRKAAKRTGEDDFLSVCHLSLRFHQVLEQDHGYLSKRIMRLAIYRHISQYQSGPIHNVLDQITLMRIRILIQLFNSMRIRIKMM